MNKFDVLIGQVVTSLWVDREEERIAIVTDKAVYLFATYAECCSETWFADILGYDALIGATIVAAELKDIEGVDQSRTRQEEDVAYGYTLVTSKGRVDLVFRNSSNGYYGGEVKNGVIIKEIPDTFRQINDDWSA